MAESVLKQVRTKAAAQCVSVHGTAIHIAHIEVSTARMGIDTARS